MRTLSTSRVLFASVATACATALSAAVATAQSALPSGVPDLCASSTIASARSGAWSDPSTWSPSRVPGSGDRVRVDAGDTVTYDVVNDTALTCVGVRGKLSFTPGANTRLTVATILVYEGGTLTVGTASAPVPEGVTAEIVIANQSPNTSTDPTELGTGLVGYGTVDMYGAEKTPTWTRLAQEPRAGNTTLTLAQPVSGWRAGDRLILPDTRHLQWNEVSGWMRKSPQWEELAVANISSDRRVVTLTAALRFDHFGARDGLDGNGTLRLLPHVGNLTRNVVVRSQAPIGGGVQGHVFFAERADVDIRYVAFRDLGRTQTGGSSNNGRYPVYFDDLMGPERTPANGYQYTFVGNAVDGGSTNHKKRWGITIGNSHYGLVSDNVLYNYAGALLATDDGGESYNVIERNFAVRSSGTGGRLGDGNEGQGFWFRGPNNYVRGNVAANFDSDDAEAAYGYKYFMYKLGTVHIPTAKGQDESSYVAVDGNNLPILEFSDNEVYSAAQGLTYWWLSSQDPNAPPDARESVFRDLRIWHVYNVAVYHYPAARVRFDGVTILGQNPAKSACCVRGFFAGDYAETDLRIVNADIEGMGIGISPATATPGLQTIENSTLRNRTDLRMQTLYSTNGPGWLPPRKVIANNVQFLGTTTISMEYDSNSMTNNTQKDELFVYSYRGNPSDNFQVSYNEQAGRNVAGGAATCGNHRSEIDGIVCATAASGGPAITWVEPFQGSTAGGTPTKLYGANFISGATVTFGGTPATRVIVDGPNDITVTAAPHAAGNVDVKVTNPNGQAAIFPKGFRYVSGAGSGCTRTVSPTSSSVDARGGTGVVTVTMDNNCNWSATSEVAWISIGDVSNGNAGGTVTYAVNANTGSSTRTGTLTVAGTTVTVTQQGAPQSPPPPPPPCSYSVSPTSASASAAGGAGSVNVTTATGCSWTATSNANWIGITSGNAGSGNGMVTYAIDPNLDAIARKGTLSVAGQTVSLAQAGQPPINTNSPLIDATAYGDQPSANKKTVTTSTLSTTADNELLVAFVATDGLANATVAKVAGGGLKWELVRRTNVQLGTAEVWRAYAAQRLKNVAITATLADPAASSMTVVSFANVDSSGQNGSGAVGATASGNSRRGTPSATLTTTRNNSWVFGVGNDWDTATPRTLGPNQVMVHQYMAPVGDTYWVQRTASAVPRTGTKVTMGAVAPSKDRYNLTLVEILASPQE